MIHSVTLSNFSVIREEVTIPLASLSLFFGMNGAGKSSVAKALQFTCNYLNRRYFLESPGAVWPPASAPFDAGELGFSSLVHAHSVGAPLNIGIEMTEFPATYYSEWQIELPRSYRRKAETLFELFHSGHAVRASFSFSAQEGVVRLMNYAVAVNGLVLGQIAVRPGAQPVVMINHDYPEFGGATAALQSTIYGTTGELQLNLRDALPIAGFSVVDSPRGGSRLHRYPVGERAREQRLFIHFLHHLFETPVRRLSQELGRARWVSGVRAMPEGAPYYADALLPLANRFDVRSACHRLEENEPLRADVEAALGAILNWPLRLALRKDTKKLEFLDARHNAVMQPTELSLGIVTALPVIVAALDAENRGEMGVVRGLGPTDDLVPAGGVFIEEPEAHLHPSAVVGIADVFVDASLRAERSLRKKIVAETHSEHLVLRVLRRLREEKKRPVPMFNENDLAILYFDAHKYLGKPFRIGLDEEGRFRQPWPDDFFRQDQLERFA